jgi:hypothetical protein
MTPEQRFYQALFTKKTTPAWLVQRIETLTSSGIPDVFACPPGLESMWLELKVCNDTNVQIRKSQYPILKAWGSYLHIFVLALDPRSHFVSIYDHTAEGEAGRKDHVKLVTPPLLKSSIRDVPNNLIYLMKNADK